MSKKVPVYINENELRHVLRALDEMPWSTEGVNSELLIERLNEELDRSFDNEEDEPWSPLYNGSKDKDK